MPDIDSYVGLAHTLFALEDLYGIHIGEIVGEVCLRLDKSKDMTYLSMFDLFTAWQQKAEKLASDKISQLSRIMDNSTLQLCQQHRHNFVINFQSMLQNRCQ